MLAATLGFVALALVGHAALWIGIINRWHATGFPRAVVKGTTALFYLALFGLPVVIAWPEKRSDRRSPPASDLAHDSATGYMVLCAAYGLFHLHRWAWDRWELGGRPAAVLAGASRRVDVCQQLGAAPTTSPRTRFFCRIPFNELWQLEVSEFEVRLPGLPAALDGVSICHLSDLHFSSRIDRAYYEEVARITNGLSCDLIALTGDVCDKARLIDWVPDTLGRMTARLGKFSILGNHDLRTRDVERLRSAKQAAGFVDVGSGVHQVSGVPLVIAGNERPWFKTTAPSPHELPQDHLKLLLSHTPDQYAWARQLGFDLMLAGHTHGGQVCFPVIGPVICPSWYGTRYASGFFHEPPTLLHVSRGTASLFPYRLNCRPEITKLVLRRAA